MHVSSSDRGEIWNYDLGYAGHNIVKNLWIPSDFFIYLYSLQETNRLVCPLMVPSEILNILGQHMIFFNFFLYHIYFNITIITN